MPSDIFDKLSRINLSRKCCAQLNYGKAASVLKAVERWKKVKMSTRAD